jgi:hypothetical protein
MAGVEVTESSTFPKEGAPYEMQAKAFEKGAGADDAEAFAEAGGPAEAGASVAGGGASVATTTNWRPAKSLNKLKEQVNAAFPGRNKASDGMIGNAAHCGPGAGGSDHCARIPDGGVGVVTAFDITHDTASGCDAQKIVEAIVDSQDQRVKYVIWNSHIWNSSAMGAAAPWAKRPYSGSNPHNKHMHVSVLGSKAKYDDDSAWQISTGGGVGV